MSIALQSKKKRAGFLGEAGSFLGGDVEVTSLWAQGWGSDHYALP